MSAAIVNGSLYGIPGVGLYNINEDLFRDCCCNGLIIGGTSIVITGSPDCNIVAQGNPKIVCSYGNIRPDRAVELAMEYIAELNYITKCRPTALNPDPETNFCQNKIPAFTMTNIAENLGNGYKFEFIVEDCGIPPFDYLFYVTVNFCK